MLLDMSKMFHIDCRSTNVLDKTSHSLMRTEYTSSFEHKSQNKSKQIRTNLTLITSHLSNSSWFYVQTWKYYMAKGRLQAQLNSDSTPWTVENHWYQLSLLLIQNIVYILYF